MQPVNHAYDEVEEVAGGGAGGAADVGAGVAGEEGVEVIEDVGGGDRVCVEVGVAGVARKAELRTTLFGARMMPEPTIWPEGVDGGDGVEADELVAGERWVRRTMGVEPRPRRRGRTGRGRRRAGR